MERNQCDAGTDDIPAVPESQEVLIVIGAGLSKERISGILGIK